MLRATACLSCRCLLVPLHACDTVGNVQHHDCTLSLRVPHSTITDLDYMPIPSQDMSSRFAFR